MVKHLPDQKDSNERLVHLQPAVRRTDYSEALAFAEGKQIGRAHV